jgi:hypothetical protein
MTYFFAIAIKYVIFFKKNFMEKERAAGGGGGVFPEIVF